MTVSLVRIDIFVKLPVYICNIEWLNIQFLNAKNHFIFHPYSVPAISEAFLVKVNPCICWVSLCFCPNGNQPVQTFNLLFVFLWHWTHKFILSSWHGALHASGNSQTRPSNSSLCQKHRSLVSQRLASLPHRRKRSSCISSWAGTTTPQRRQRIHLHPQHAHSSTTGIKARCPILRPCLWAPTHPERLSPCRPNILPHHKQCCANS